MEGALQDRMGSLFNSLKNGPACPIPIYRLGQPGILAAVGWSDANDPEAVARLATWQEMAESLAPPSFPFTPPGARAWLIEQVLDIPDRLLFWVQSPKGKPIGHLRLCRFDARQRTMEIDQVMRGEAKFPGLMTHAVGALCRWAGETLGLDRLVLRIPSSNGPAMRLAARCGFLEQSRGQTSASMNGRPPFDVVLTYGLQPARALAA
jgi:RimJ/RimL family protein N-acetyltransferase